MTAFFVVDVIGWVIVSGCVCKLFMNYLLNICFNLRWQAKRRAGSIKRGGEKILAPAAKKEKILGANFNNAPAGGIIIPRGFFDLAFC